MTARKKKRPLRPRTPSRVKKRGAKRKRARAGGLAAHHRASHQHPELVGLALVALGLFLASLLYLGWEGGIVGEKVESGLRDLLGSAAYATPILLAGVGGLMLFRSALIDVRPFRIGLGVILAGLLTTLGSRNGGFVGDAFGGALAALLGGTGSFLVGLTALLAGALLLTGASAGALLRHSGRQLRRAGTAARSRIERNLPNVIDAVSVRHEHAMNATVAADCNIVDD